MEALLLLAAKSLAIAGGTLALLKLMQRRSAADRSWVAHLGLLALLLLPVGTAALPAMEIAGPSALAPEPAAESPAPAPVADPVATAISSVGENATAVPTVPQTDGIDWVFWAYATPAALLLLLTLVALARLTLLKVRAEVLVDAHWLQALARAQKRMGFKSGTALLTSDELRSPISWGLMRPVILLNTDAKEARGEAEAIIAHELAHVARLDWAKLMLSRVTVAIFWFNPLVWLLAREAHQLREEAADDAVLAADIEDTEYANLLVGIARHECRGLLLGAHGVAPGRGSLTRRVKRVLDAALERAPGGWKWSSAAAFFAAGMTVPVAALQIVAPAAAASSERSSSIASDHARGPVAIVETMSDLSADLAASFQEEAPIVLQNGEKRITVTEDGRTVATLPVAGRAIAIAKGTEAQADRALDRAIERKAVGASSDYVRALREAAPALRLSHDAIVDLAATGVSADYVRDLVAAGHRVRTAADIIDARALGITGAYVRGFAAAGYPDLSLDELQSLKALGVTPADAAKYRRAGRGLPSVDALISAKATGLDPDDIDPHDGD